MVSVDLAHGGRWTSLRLAGREWLWHRDAPRAHVRPGHAFVDAGGLEECLPTVRGTPDHGDAWSRPWRSDGTVECPDFTLTRTIEHEDDEVRARYCVQAEPGYRFVWAAHALLDVSDRARVIAPAGAPLRYYPDDGPWTAATWPGPDDLSVLGPDDGTAVGGVLPDLGEVSIVDAPHTLRMSLTAPSDVPTSIALWRNLRGFPDDEPYRSVGVEPMLGRVFDLTEAAPGDAAIVPDSGELTWTLRIDAVDTSIPERRRADHQTS